MKWGFCEGLLPCSSVLFPLRAGGRRQEQILGLDFAGGSIELSVHLFRIVVEKRHAIAI